MMLERQKKDKADRAGLLITAYVKTLMANDNYFEFKITDQSPVKDCDLYGHTLVHTPPLLHRLTCPSLAMLEVQPALCYSLHNKP